MAGTDRRGLSEIIAWVAALGALTIIIVVDLIIEKKIDHALAGSLGGLILALASRGTQSASERRAIEEREEQQRLPPRREPSSPRIPLDYSDTRPEPKDED